jgi:hypothetical protein
MHFNKIMKNITFFLLLVFLFIGSNSNAQELSNSYIKEQIKSYKLDNRGPYRDIRWFCTNGSIREPKDPCPPNIGPGVQHARYKTEVENIGAKNQIYLAQIIAFTKSEDLWDAKNDQSRLKQYQLGKYLYGVDKGWILEKAQFYRGAIQAEDEEEAGIDFYKWLLAKDENIEKNFFLIRQSMKDVAHSDDNNIPQLMRSQSKVISDVFPQFMDLRIKIHGQPDAGDIPRVKEFKEKYATKLSAGVSKQLDELVVTMEQFYTPIDINQLLRSRNMLRKTTLGATVTAYMTKYAGQTDASVLIPETAQLLYLLRKEILNEKRGIVRMQILDVSLKLEEIIFQNEPRWIPETIQELNKKIYCLALGTAGAGFVELWEWEQLNKSLKPKENVSSISLGELNKHLEAGRSAVEWSAAMVKASYQKVVNDYAAFEPLANGFIDDRIRGSIALHLGKNVGELGDIIATESSLTNKVMNISNQSSVRGLNPGYAFGELVVVEDASEEMEVSPDKIYVFQRPPSDLKPIAGIATVAEGNLVSHVQLLARNLGIPNAALSDENLRSLKKFSGQKVFYAVSNKGNVILKAEKDMTGEEKELFSKKVRKEEKIAVPVERIRLDETKVLNLRDVDASDSGNLCGPKAANLGQLKKMFPENVVEGLVIPFGIFREHMDQMMPGQNKTYWRFLNDMFSEAEKMRSRNIPEGEIEKYQLQELETLRAAIKKMPLKADFTSSLESKFKSILGKQMGEIPVFLRSDTNMEDLKDFTGAGLNLTVFNVSEKNKILEGIKDVWASPYTERSFKWRQKYLSNPENVFPSILVIPSVDVDHSGVLITKGISSGNDNDLTVAFSRGAGGAVDGQAAEQYLIRMDETYDLLAPAREPRYNRLPFSGGTLRQTASFNNRVLSEADIHQICELAEKIRETLPKETNSDYKGAYDVELGFKDGKLWLFQIRPFVENKKALSSGYLESITPKIDNTKEISLATKI